MEDNGREELMYKGKLKPEFISKAKRMYERYKADKSHLEQRVMKNTEWYRAQYGRMLNPETNETEPATAFIFSAIENKYADAIDNYPVPNLLEREPSDSQTAKILSKIIPVQLDISGFKKVYKRNWRLKLKNGTAVYGVFYNDTRDDIDIRAIDIMTIYCDMHLRDVQESQFLFITNAIDNDILTERYPRFAALFKGDASVTGYGGQHTIEDRTEVIDCYYKKTDGTLHMMKLCHGYVIDATEDTTGYEDGLYEHGMYPVVFDVLYPEEDCPFGFGIVDVIRNPQQYIDKLDAVIIKNSIIAGKTRYFIKDHGTVNEREFEDLSKELVHVSGSIDETSIRPIEASSLPQQVLEHRKEKIQELKEVIGNRDFQQGGTTGSVTAASAITTLQQAGEKLSRALIDDSYDVYKSVVVMMIDLMREFYDGERVYRITNEQGAVEFARFSGNMLYREEEEKDALGFVTGTEYKRTEFDIDVVPQRENPFTKEGHNQTVMSLWSAGFFNPQSLDLALIALQIMNFDGKEQIIEQLREYKQQYDMQMQQQAMTGEGGGELIPVGKTGTSAPQLEGDSQLIPVGKV